MKTVTILNFINFTNINFFFFLCFFDIIIASTDVALAHFLFYDYIQDQYPEMSLLMIYIIDSIIMVVSLVGLIVFTARDRFNFYHVFQAFFRILLYFIAIFMNIVFLVYFSYQLIAGTADVKYASHTSVFVFICGMMVPVAVLNLLWSNTLRKVITSELKAPIAKAKTIEDDNVKSIEESIEI